MISIPWNTLPPKSRAKHHTADVGDLRIILIEQEMHWTLNFGIRVYSKDRTKSMVRPHVCITTFDKPCTLETAKTLTEEYLEEFLSKISSAITIVD